jgi:hypothetical protein
MSLVLQSNDPRVDEHVRIWLKMGETFDHFARELRELLLKVYPAPQHILLDPVLAQFLLEQPHFSKSLLVAVLDAFHQRSLPYNKRTPPFYALVALFGGGTGADPPSAGALLRLILAFSLLLDDVSAVHRAALSALLLDCLLAGSADLRQRWAVALVRRDSTHARELVAELADAERQRYRQSPRDLLSAAVPVVVALVPADELSECDALFAAFVREAVPTQVVAFFHWAFSEASPAALQPLMLRAVRAHPAAAPMWLGRCALRPLLNGIAEQAPRAASLLDLLLRDAPEVLFAAAAAAAAATAVDTAASAPGGAVTVGVPLEVSVDEFGALVEAAGPDAVSAIRRIWAAAWSTQVGLRSVCLCDGVLMSGSCE